VKPGDHHDILEMKKTGKQLLSFDDFMGSTNSREETPTSEKMAAVPSTVISTPLYSGSDEELQVCCKRVLKKDETTRYKALKDIDLILKARKVLVNLEFISFFSYLFSRMPFDPSHKCREAFGEVLSFVIEADKKLIRAIIQTVIGFWWQMISDPILSVSQSYESSLNNFLQQTEVYKRYLKFTPMILAHLEQYIFINEAEFYKQLTFVDNNSEENYYRVIISNLKGLIKLSDVLGKLSLEAGSNEHSELISNSLNSFFTFENISTHFLYHKDAPLAAKINNKQLQKAAFDLFTAIISHYPSLYPVNTVLHLLDYLSHDQATDHVVLTAVLKLLHHSHNSVDNTGNNNLQDIKKLKPKEIYQFLEKLQTFSMNSAAKGFHSSSQTISQYLLSFVAHLPVESFGVYAQTDAEGKGSSSQKNYQIISAFIDLYLDTSKPETSPMKRVPQFVLAIQLITFHISRVPAHLITNTTTNSPSVVPYTSNCANLLRKLLQGFCKTFEIYISLNLSGLSLSFSFFVGHNSLSKICLLDYSFGVYSDCILDLGKCLKAIHRTTTTYFASQWNEDFWIPLHNFLSMYLSSYPILKGSKLITLLLKSATISGTAGAEDQQQLQAQQDHYSLALSVGINLLLSPVVQKLDASFTLEALTVFRVEDFQNLLIILNDLLSLNPWKADFLQKLQETYFTPENMDFLMANQLKSGSLQSSSPLFLHFLDLFKTLNSVSSRNSFQTLFGVILRSSLKERNYSILLALLYFDLSHHQQQQQRTEIIYEYSNVERDAVLTMLKEFLPHGRKEENINFDFTRLLLVIVQLPNFVGIKEEMLSLVIQEQSSVHLANKRLSSVFFLSYIKLFLSNKLYHRNQEREDLNADFFRKISFQRVCLENILVGNNHHAEDELDKNSFFASKIPLISNWELISSQLLPLLPDIQKIQLKDYLLQYINSLQMDAIPANALGALVLRYVSFACLEACGDEDEDEEENNNERILPKWLLTSFWSEFLSIHFINPSTSGNNKKAEEVKYFYHFISQSMLPVLHRANSLTSIYKLLGDYIFASPFFLQWSIFIYFQEQTLSLQNPVSHHKKTDKDQTNESVSSEFLSAMRNYWFRKDKFDKLSAEDKEQQFSEWIQFLVNEYSRWEGSGSKVVLELEEFLIYFLNEVSGILFPVERRRSVADKIER
jgi:hypothetical protein